MALSTSTIRAALRYLQIVEDYESDAFRTSGYTPREMELRRTKAHNEMLDELRREGIDTSDRAATTELARRINKWLRD